MSSIVFDKKDLQPLINHHIGLVKRFTDSNEATFSLIYFQAPKDFENSDVFEQTLRATDAIFTDGNHYIALLTGTDWNGALKVLGGIQSFFDDKNRYDDIVCYPEDGKDATALMNKLQDIIRENYNIVLDILKTNN